jgi:Fe-S-cluster containining protein
MPDFQFQLSIGEQTMDASVKLPAEPIRPVDLLPILQGFSNAIVSVAVAGSEPISCKAGCGACCRQLVPISSTEALYLANLIDEMPEERRAATVARFDRVVQAMRSAGMMERLDPEALTDPHVRQKTGEDYFHLGLACPFLENESCGIHPHRPLSCREYLVTSPAENCSAPSAETIRMVPMPAKLSYVLLRFGDGKGQEPARVIPLPLLLEYASGNASVDQARLPGTELFENFFSQLTGQSC